MTHNYPLYVKWRYITAYMLDLCAKFPKSVRFNLADRITNIALDVLEGIIDSIYAPKRTQERQHICRRLNTYIEKIRALLQITVEKRGHTEGTENTESALRKLFLFFIKKFLAKLEVISQRIQTLFFSLVFVQTFLYLLFTEDIEMKEENQLTEKIISCCLEVHKNLGAGLLESVYEEALCYELDKNNLNYKRQEAVPISYKEKFLESGFRADVIVEDRIIVEIKSVEQFSPLHFKQLLTYLKLTQKRLGLLINFNVILLKDGIRRIING